MTAHVALIREAGRRAGVRQASAVRNHVPHRLQTPHDKIAMRAGAGRLPEMPRQFVTIHAGYRFKRFRLHGPVRVFAQIVAGGFYRPQVNRPQIAPRGLVQPLQGVGDLLHQAVALQRLQGAVDIGQSGQDRAQQAGIAAGRLFDEGKGCTAQGVLNQFRTQIEHPEPEPLFGARMAVMLLVGMDDQDMTRQAVLFDAAIAEALNAAFRVTDGVGVVPVRFVGDAAEIGFVAFQPVRADALAHPVAAAGHGARTFKTDMEAACYGIAHRVYFEGGAGPMQYDTKVAIVVRKDLETWRKLNCVSFLAGGLSGLFPEIVGEPYRDGSGTVYGPLVRQPILIFQAEASELVRTNERALSRNVTPLIFTADLFATSNDADNRAAVANVPREALDLVGLALHAERKTIDKIVKGLKLHA